jgi:3-phenylpropionate/trans-cinnamate dioxygenase ferredoxin subunit
MSSFIKVLSLSDVPAGSVKTVHVNAEHIAVANVAGQLYAVDDLCSHAHCSLGTDGSLEGTTLTCGCHGAQFDVTNGKVLGLPAAVDLKTFEVKVEGADIFVKI